MEYKVGDRVKLIDKLPENRNQIEWDWIDDSPMDRFLGKYVVISHIHTLDRGQYITIEEDGGDYYYTTRAIINNEEEEKRILSEREEREKERKEALKHMIYTSEDVKRIAEEIFGEERIEMYSVNEKSFSIIIHFPELSIKNDKGMSRPMKNMFVRVSVSVASELGLYEYKAAITIQGLRTTLFLKEVHNGYSHSHLHLNNYGQWQPFCLGNSDFKVVIENLRMSLKEEDWYLFFYSIQPYLEWESREGGPYAYIENLRFGGSFQPNNLMGELARIIHEAPMDMWALTDKLGIIQGHPSFSSWIDAKSSIRSSSSTSPEVIQSGIEGNKAKLPRTPLYFKKKEFKYEIENDVEQVVPTFVSPEIKEMYKNILNTELNLFTKTFEYERRKSEEVREARII